MKCIISLLHQYYKTEVSLTSKVKYITPELVSYRWKDSIWPQIYPNLYTNELVSNKLYFILWGHWHWLTPLIGKNHLTPHYFDFGWRPLHEKAYSSICSSNNEQLFHYLFCWICNHWDKWKYNSSNKEEIESRCTENMISMEKVN